VETVGALKPEANAIPFKRAIHIKRDSEENQVRLRLRCLRDVWKLDAVQVDWTPVHPLETREVVFNSVIDPWEKTYETKFINQIHCM